MLLAKNLANPKDKEKYLELKERHYRAFLIKINRSNNYNIPFPTASFTPYKYYIGKGNNSILVRAALKTRFWWSMGDFEEWSDYNFMWTQWKSNKILDTIKPYKEFLKDQDAEKGEGSVDHSLASTFATTDKESASSTENLINTPKRQAKSQALSALKKQETLNTSNSKQPLNKEPLKPFTTGNTAPRRMNTQVKGEDGEIKEENITSHSYSTTNH